MLADYNNLGAGLKALNKQVFEDRQNYNALVEAFNKLSDTLAKIELKKQMATINVKLAQLKVSLDKQAKDLKACNDETSKLWEEIKRLDEYYYTMESNAVEVSAMNAIDKRV